MLTKEQEIKLQFRRLTPDQLTQALEYYADSIKYCKMTSMPDCEQVFRKAYTLAETVLRRKLKNIVLQ